METQDIKNFITLLNESEFRYAKINDGNTVLELSKDAMNFIETEKNNDKTNESTKTLSHCETTKGEERSEVTPCNNTPQEENVFTVKSPLVGTFYESSSPEVKAFVKVGDQVKAGDTLCIIEAMKLMNEIEAEVGGKIIEILVSNEGPVEYGQPLYKIAQI
jgi:acetyl-CoA carboxylase biotin carboxyl carrier protein